VWWLEANSKLPAPIRALLDNKDLDLHLAAIVVAEIVDLCIKGRTGLKLEPVLAVLREDQRFVMHDFTVEMAIGTSKYAALPDIHDRCIVATAAKLIESGRDALLVTRDRAIRESRLVPILW
jgi:PIN domain nuclease of toxin-antitoxin system